MDFFMKLADDRVSQDSTLRKVRALIDWQRLAAVLGPWHSLSDRELERALTVRLDFMLFCGQSMIERSPDHTTICRFRRMLGLRGLDAALLSEVNRQLQERGLKVRNAPVAVVDATIVESAARPRRQIEVVAEDRAEGEAPEISVSERLSADPDARWLKKGGRCLFGYKGFVRTDGEGFVERVLARPANEGEAPHFPAMVSDCTARRVLADKGLSSAANRACLTAAGIMFRASRGHPLSRHRRRFNRLVSRRRWIVEQTFGTLKRLFGAARSRFMGRRAVEAELTFKSMALNLLKAANRIKLVAA